MIKICFVQHASEGVFVRGIAKKLQKNNIEFKVVCKTQKAHKEYLEAGFDSFYISDIFSKKEKLSQKELDALELKYNSSSIVDIINSDLHLKYFFGKNKSRARQLVGLAYKFWEDFFNQYKIDYILTREIATFATRTAYNVAMYKKIPLSQIAVGPGGDYFILSDVGKTSVWSESLDALQNKKKLIDSEQKKVVYDFIQKRISSTCGKMNLRFVPASLIKSIKNLLGTIIRDTRKNRKNDPIRVAALRYGRDLLSKRLKWRYFTNNFFNYDFFDRSKKFIYFPLYSGNETGYLVDNYYWANNQLSLIKKVAQSLPAGFYLYVKEHPLNPGYFSFSELKHLQNISNVKILHPSISSQDLIEKSKAVFVLQGTVGWEAFLTKKPVINLGETFYSYSSLVYKIKNINDLSNVILKAIKSGSKIYDDKKEEWMSFIYLAITTCGRGSIVRLKPPYGFNTDESNFKKVADFIQKKIKRDLNKTNKNLD